MTADTFTRGVNWGKFTARMFDEDDRAEGARAAALEAAADYLTDHPDDRLMDAMTGAWFGYLCHGRLKVGETCPRCGAYDPGPDQ